MKEKYLFVENFLDEAKCLLVENFLDEGKIFAFVRLP